MMVKKRDIERVQTKSIENRKRASKRAHKIWVMGILLEAEQSKSRKALFLNWFTKSRKKVERETDSVFYHVDSGNASLRLQYV